MNLQREEWRDFDEKFYGVYTRVVKLQFLFHHQNILNLVSIVVRIEI